MGYFMRSGPVGDASQSGTGRRLRRIAAGILAASLLAPALAAPAVAGPGPHPTGPSEADALPGWHAIEHGLHAGEEPGDLPAGLDMGRSTSATVFGFLPYWADEGSIQYDLVSVLACFGIDMGSSGSITAWHGFPSAFAAPIASVHSAGGQAVVTVVCFSQSSIHSILTTSKAAAIGTLLGVMGSSPVDGICIDFENVGPADRDALTAFVAELRAALDSQYPGSHLSICTPAVDWSDAFDYAALAASCDALMMMCYPFHGSWSTEAGPCCPLTGWGTGPESPANMMWSLGDYVIRAPGVHGKLVVGLPYYGFEWETGDQFPHAQATGACATLVYSTLAQRAGEYGRLWDSESNTPWYAYEDGTWNQGWFDDPESLGMKYAVIRASGMQGIGIWALGYDGERPELWECLDEYFTAPWPPDDMTDNLESTFELAGPPQYWHYHGTGQLYSHFYTYTIESGPDVNSSVWNFTLPDSTGSYMLEAWIPGDGTADALYRIVRGSSVDTVLVGQADFAGCWAPLGGPYYAGQGLQVVVGDCTGTTGQRLSVDCVRFTAAGWAGGGPSAPGPALSVSPGPACSFTITAGPLGAGGSLSVVDLAGRRVYAALVPGNTAVSVAWPAGGSPDGLYFAVLECGGALAAEPMLLLRAASR